MHSGKPNVSEYLRWLSFLIDMKSGIITEYDDKLTRQLIEQIIVFEDKFQVLFKSGVDIEVEI